VNGETLTDIAKTYNVNHATIMRIVAAADLTTGRCLTARCCYGGSTHLGVYEKCRPLGWVGPGQRPRLKPALLIERPKMSDRLLDEAAAVASGPLRQPKNPTAAPLPLLFSAGRHFDGSAYSSGVAKQLTAYEAKL
jgi:hypothetical protein